MTVNENNQTLPAREALLKTRVRISKYVHLTPVMTSRGIDRICSAAIFFKCENFQRTGSFKFRGALNAIMNLADAEKRQGVITHSSGNFAQALALASREQGIQATVIMPATASRVKRTATEGYGASVVECGSTLDEREATLRDIAEETSAVFIHPSNQFDVILGQSTAAQEFINNFPQLDFLLAPVGGGGLIAGTALAAYYLSPETEVLGAEPFGADDAYQSLKAGEIIPCKNPRTIADGLKTSLGDKNFPIIQALVKNIIRVEENEIFQAMQLVWERLKIVIEPSSAVALAAVIRRRDQFTGKKVGIILSGGNVDLNQLPF